MKKVLFIFIAILILSVSVFCAEVTLYTADGNTGYYNGGINPNGTVNDNSGGATAANLAGDWRSNNTRAWKLAYTYDGSAVSTRYVSWTVQFEQSSTNTSGGLPAGEDMYIDIVPDVPFSINTASYSALALQMEIVDAGNLGDETLGESSYFSVSVKLNGSADWTDLGTASGIRRSAPTGKTLTTTISGTAYDGIMWLSETGNLKDGLASDGTITAIRLYPYGKGAVRVRNLCLRIGKITLKGYTGSYTPPEPVSHGKTYVTVSTDYLRSAIVANMDALGSFTWATDTSINFNPANGVGGTGPDAPGLTYPAGITLRGTMYTSGGNVYSTKKEYLANLDGNGKYKNAASVTLANALGTVCSSAIQVAAAPYIHTPYLSTAIMIAGAGENGIKLTTAALRAAQIIGGNAQATIDAVNNKQTVFEGYAALNTGDVIIDDGHTRLVHSAAVVSRNGDNTINGTASRIYVTENAGSVINGSSFRINKYYTFEELYADGYLPYTFDVYSDGRVEEAYIESFGLPTYDVISNGFSGVILSNYRFDTVKAAVYTLDGTLVDSQERYTCNYSYVLSRDFSELNGKIKSYTDHKNYRYVLTATTGPLTSATDEYDEVTLLDLTYPKHSAPGNVGWNVNAGSWSAPVGEDIAGYKVTLYKNGSEIAEYDTTETVCDFADAIIDGGAGEYYYTVSAKAKTTGIYIDGVEGTSPVKVYSSDMLSTSYHMTVIITGGGSGTLSYLENGVLSSGAALSINDDFLTGTQLVITATADAGSKFLYYKDVLSGKVLSSESSLTVSLGSNADIQAVIIPDIQGSETHYVSFEDFNRRIIWSGGVDEGTNLVAQLGDLSTLRGTYFGYEFDSWSCDYSNITEDLTVKALYRKAEKTYKVKVMYGDVLHEELVKLYDEEVTVDITGAIPAGKYFGGWSFDGGTTVASYALRYKFYTAGNMTVTAVIGDSAVSAVPTVTIFNNYCGGLYVSFISSRNIPQGYSFIESGIIFTKIDKPSLTLADVDTVNNTVKQSKTVSLAANGQYQLNVSTEDGTVYAAAYLKYKDELGVPYVIYSPVVQGTLLEKVDTGIIEQYNGEI